MWENERKTPEAHQMKVHLPFTISKIRERTWNFLSADLTFILTRPTFPLKRSREGSGDKWEVREGEREWKTPTLAHKRSAFPSEETTANSIKAGLWRKLTSAVRMNPFWRLRILYLIGQHTNEAISIATPNAGALITGCGCQGNSIRVSEGANEENMELSRPPHTPN